MNCLVWFVFTGISVRLAGMMSSFLREAGTAVFLECFTLCLQCAGMAALISFAKT